MQKSHRSKFFEEVMLGITASAEAFIVLVFKWFLIGMLFAGVCIILGEFQ